MAKNILITPYRNSTNPLELPKIDFINGSTAITLQVEETTQSITYVGSAGTLLQINNDLTGTTVSTKNIAITGVIKNTGITSNSGLNDFVVVDIATGQFYYRSAPTGTSGSSGQSGTSGTSGANGSSGTSGANGSSGTSGANGSSGTSGANGSSGTSASSGTSGSTGSSGTSGANGSSGTSGVNWFIRNIRNIG